jgi:hypothetical protein
MWDADLLSAISFAAHRHRDQPACLGRQATLCTTARRGCAGVEFGYAARTPWSDDK